MRGVFPVPVSQTHFFALSDLALSSYVTLVCTGTNAVIGLQVGSTNVASSFTTDGNIHDFLVVFDLTTVSLVVDGTLVGTNATLTTMPTTPSAVVVAANGSMVKIQEYGFGYV